MAAIAALAWVASACAPDRAVGVRIAKLKTSSECYAQLRIDGDTETPDPKQRSRGLSVSHSSSNSCQELGAVVVVADADDSGAKAWMCHNFSWCNGQPIASEQGWRFVVPSGLSSGGGLEPVQLADGDSIFVATPKTLAMAWSKAAHDHLLALGLGTKLTFEEMELVKKVSMDQDELYNFDNRRHYLANEKQSPQAAQAASQLWQESMLDYARQAQQEGDRTLALRYLAMALHQIMDSYSPAHADAQGLPREYPSWGHTFYYFGGESLAELMAQGNAPEIATKILQKYNSVFP